MIASAATKMEGEAEYEVRVARSIAAVTAALEAAGWTVERSDESLSNRPRIRARRTDTPSLFLQWNSITTPGRYRYRGKRGDERFSVLVGDPHGYPSVHEKVQSAKDDPDLVGPRVARVVEAVDHVTKVRLQHIARVQKERENAHASKAIATACNKTMRRDGAAHEIGSFLNVDHQPNTVQFKADCYLEKADAERLAKVLATFTRSDS